jgi:ribose-phosphate pyrophosphokinase
MMKQGAKAVYACATHAVLSDNAIEKVEGSALKQLVVTNTIAWNGGCKKVKVLSIAPLLGEAIKRIHQADSVSSLFV